MINKKIISSVLFALVVAIALFMRLWQLDKVPVSLFGDELDVGLQGYSILTTGKDYLGNSLPVMFHSFSEYRLPLQLYLVVPFIKLLGLNEWAVRLPAVVCGLTSLILMYFLVKEIFGKKVAFVALVFLAVSPWHLMYSRQANDAGILLPFIIGGTLFFIKGLGSYKALVISAVIFSLSIYAYAISSLFVPLFATSLLLIFRKEIFGYGIKKIAVLAAVVLVLLSPYLIASFKGLATQRFSYISLGTSDRVLQEVLSRRKWSNTLVERLFYNRGTVLAEDILRNYLNSFSTTFLFTSGDPNLRQSTGNFGEFYHYDLLLILIGLVALIRFGLEKKDRRIFAILLVWLVFAPIPSALTRDGGTHASRLILMIVPLIVLSSYGIVSIMNNAKTRYIKLFVLIFTFLMIFEVGRHLNYYFVIWPNTSARFWQTGFKESMQYVRDNQDKYNTVFINNTYEPALPRFLFWTGYDMSLFQKQFVTDVPSDNIVSGFDGFVLGDKYYFGQMKKPVEGFTSADRLIVASAQDDITNPDILKGGIKLLKTVYSPEDLPIFYIYTGSGK